MTAFAFSEEYPFFSDTNGAALDSGYVYIGTASLDPRTNPIPANRSPIARCSRPAGFRKTQYPHAISITR